MFRYTGAKCPVCNKYFQETDDIVVCPECGAPHHRACWQQNGRCGCFELHAAGQSWRSQQPVPAEAGSANAEPASAEATSAEVSPEEPAAQPTPPADGLYSAPEDAEPAGENEQDNEPAADKSGKDGVCPFCHTVNTPGSRFCNRCGAPLGQAAPSFRPIVIDPLGGVKPDEELGGARVKDIAAVVGKNTGYYVPRFHVIEKLHRKIMPNLAAMLFDGAWFFYRKMPMQGIAVLLIQLALFLPQGWYLFINDSPTFLTAYYICFYLSYAVRLAVGLVANRFYFTHCTRTAAALREQHPEDADFQAAAEKSGGVNRPVLTVFAVIYGILYLAYFIFLLI